MRLPTDSCAAAIGARIVWAKGKKRSGTSPLARSNSRIAFSFNLMHVTQRLITQSPGLGCPESHVVASNTSAPDKRVFRTADTIGDVSHFDKQSLEGPAKV